MSRPILIALLWLTSMRVQGQEQKLSTWQKDSVSLNDKVFDATYLRDNWKVRKVGADILVSRPKAKYIRGDSLTIPVGRLNPELHYQYGLKLVKKVSDGFLIAANSFESTYNELWFVRNDAMVQYRLTSEHQIQRIFEFQSRLYAIHSSGYEPGSGRILEITRNATGQWEAKTLINLAEAPVLTVVSADRVCILTAEHLGILNPDLTLTTVLRGPYKWGMLQPASMVVDGPDLYLGTRWGVFKIKDFAGQPEYGWYIPPGQ